MFKSLPRQEHKTASRLEVAAAAQIEHEVSSSAIGFLGRNIRGESSFWLKWDGERDLRIAQSGLE